MLRPIPRLRQARAGPASLPDHRSLVCPRQVGAGELADAERATASPETILGSWPPPVRFNGHACCCSRSCGNRPPNETGILLRGLLPRRRKPCRTRRTSLCCGRTCSPLATVPPKLKGSCGKPATKTPSWPRSGPLSVMLADRQEDWEKAETLLEESRKALGDSVEQRLIQAQHFVRHRQKDTAKRLRKLAENDDQFPEPARLALWSGLLDAAIQVGDTEQADSLAQKINEKQPNNVRSSATRFWIGRLPPTIKPRSRRPWTTSSSSPVKACTGSMAKPCCCLSGIERQPKIRSRSWKRLWTTLAKARELRKDWSKISVDRGENLRPPRQVGIGAPKLSGSHRLGRTQPRPPPANGPDTLPNATGCRG